MAKGAFTVRIGRERHELLESLAHLHGVPPAALAAQMIDEGIRAMLDPVDIEARSNAERDRLLAESRRMRGEDGDSHG